MRIMLLQLLAALHQASGDKQRHAAAMQRLFERQLRACAAAPGGGGGGDIAADFGVHDGEHFCCSIVSGAHAGRCFHVVRDSAPPAAPAACAQLARIEEVTSASGRAAIAAALRRCGEQDANEPLLQPYKQLAAAKKLPAPPRASCAGCGARAAPDGAALKQCDACRTVSYCGRACQRSHWAAHKPACRAARPKPGGAAGGVSA
jgi:hypothetical protein